MRILVVAQAFAPAGGSHSTRVTNIVKELATLGHEVSVLTATTGRHKPELDPGLLERVPASVRVIRAFHGPLHEYAYRKSRGGRGGQAASSSGTGLKGLLCPDTYVEWLPFALARFATLARTLRPELILSSATPYTSHLIGLALKKLTGALWVADSGDPWVYEPMHPRSGWRLGLESRMESAVLRNCDWFTVTTGPTRELYARTYPVTVGKTSVVSMGFAPDDYPAQALPPKGPFSFVHTGRLTVHRDGTPFVRALAELKDELVGKAEFVFYGEVPQQLKDEIAAAGVAELVRCCGWISNRQCMAELKNAGALMLFGNNNAIQVPGKLFNYMGSGTPLLYLKNHDEPSDPCAEIIGAYPCSTAAPEPAAIKRSIMEAMALQRANNGCLEGHTWRAKAGLLDGIFTGLSRERGGHAAR